MTALLAAAANGVRVTSSGPESPESLSAAAEGAPARDSGPVVMARDQAAAWIASQVGGDVIVACDPAMCSVLLAHGVLAGNQWVLWSATADPLGSDVVVATAAVRSQFGTRLASVYAQRSSPASARVTRGSTSGRSRRTEQPLGRELAADLAARRAAGRQLLLNSQIRASRAARAALLSGQVDDRLMITLAAMAAAGPLQIEAFGARGPGAGSGCATALGRARAARPPRRRPLRGCRACSRSCGRSARQYLAERAALVRGAHGSPALSVLFAAPSPLGLLLQAQATPLADGP